MSETASGETARITAMFDALAGEYDRSGAPFFGPIAAGLVQRLAPQPGESVAELGCGKGACTVLLAEAVGPTGLVEGVDLSAEMMRHGRAAIARRGLDWASMRLGDASDPPLPAGRYDVVAASLVLFFLPDPVAALARWHDLLVPGGRLGVATFQPWTGVWETLEEIAARHRAAPPSATAGERDVFDSDEGVEGLFTQAGLTGVRTEALEFAVPFEDFEQWRAWSLAGPGGGLWRGVAEERRPELAGEFAAELADHRDGRGTIRLPIPVRYTLAGRGAGASSPDG